MRTAVACLIAAALVFPNPAQAIEPPKHGVYVGVYGGINLVLEQWLLGEAAKQGTVELEDSPIVGVRIGAQALRWLGFEFQADILLLKTAGETEVAERFTLNAIIQPWKDLVSPYLLLGGGFYHTGSSALGSDIDYALSIGLGMRAMLTDWMALRVEGINTFTDGPGHIAYNLSVTGGLDFFVWRSSDDRDGDEILDQHDDCPDEKGPIDTKGCPDRDGDGIGDVCDFCPLVPSAVVSEEGQILQYDADGDGVGDACDNCRNLPNPDQADADDNGIGDPCDIQVRGGGESYETQCGTLPGGPAGWWPLIGLLVGLGSRRSRRTVEG